MAYWTVKKFDKLTDEQLEASIALQSLCMKDDLSALCLACGNAEYIPDTARAMIPAAAFIGEYYGAVDKNTGEILGFVIWVPPGEDLNSTPEQRALGLDAFMAKLSDEGRQYFQSVMKDTFTPFCDRCLGGPSTKRNSRWLNLAMVHPDHQRKGIMRALIRPGIEKAIQEGDQCAVSCTNSRNVDIYRALGFELLGEQPMPSAPWGQFTMYVLGIPKKQYKNKLADVSI